MIAKDPKGRYAIGIIESPAAAFAFRTGEGTGSWILDMDGKVYFGHQLPPPEVGFGITAEHETAPPVLLEALAELVAGMYDALDDGGEELETLERLPEVIMEGLGTGRDEAEDIAEAILEEAERLDECPWKLTAMHIAGVDWGVVGEPEYVGEFPKRPDIPLAVREKDPQGEAEIIPFPLHRARKPSSKEE